MLKSNRKIIGVDWSRAKGVYAFDGCKVTRYADLSKLASSFPGSVVILEATAESFQLQNRDKVIEAFETNGIVSFCYNTKYTARFRKKHSLKKSDYQDCQVIRRIATETKTSLHKFSRLRDNDPIRDAVSLRLVEDRYLYDGKRSELLANGYVSFIPEEFKNFLTSGNSKKPKFRKPIGRFLCIAEEVRKQGRGFREFRRQIGNYGNGYGSMARSEFYHWWTRCIANSMMNRNCLTALTSLTPKQKEIHKQVLRKADQVLKHLWSLTKVQNASVSVPENTQASFFSR